MNEKNVLGTGCAFCLCKVNTCQTALCFVCSCVKLILVKQRCVLSAAV